MTWNKKYKRILLKCKEKGRCKITLFKVCISFPLFQNIIYKRMDGRSRIVIIFMNAIFYTYVDRWEGK